MSQVSIVDQRSCTLGEGAFWHPTRKQLFWFDILNKKLLSQDKNHDPLEWNFDEFVSAAGWIDGDALLIASETALFKFNLEQGERTEICALEADNPITRSNDGRADPWGGFWIGTMGKQAEEKAGAIYRYYRGELRQLFPSLTITNAICFSPDRRYAYFADTAMGAIWRQALDEKDGWPIGLPTMFIDCKKEGLNPDGAVVDAQGRLWNAQWGASRVACYSPEGKFKFAIHLPAEQITCPAFGGEELSTLFTTSAKEGLKQPVLLTQPQAGKTFSLELETKGQREHQFVL